MEENTTGLTKNTFKIIESTSNLGQDAIIDQNADAKDGTYAKVRGPNKIIVDTGYFPINELIGLHQVSVRWFSSISSGNGIQIQYWRKDASGNEANVSNVDVPWNNDISPLFGNSGGFSYFFENYQYRIVIVSEPSIFSTDWVAVDYIKLVPNDMWALKGDAVYGGAYNGNVPGVPQLINYTFNVPAGGSASSYTATVSLNSCKGTSVVAAINDANVDRIVKVNNVTDNSFDVTVTHRAGTTWSGQCGVTCFIYTHVYGVPL